MSDTETTTTTQTETQRACDIIRQAHELLGPNMENWVQGYFAKDEHGNTVEITSPKAVQFCMLGALAHVAGVNNDDPYYWDGPLRKAYNFLRETARDFVHGQIDAVPTTTRTVWGEYENYVWDEETQQHKYVNQTYSFDVTETKWREYDGSFAVYGNAVEPDYLTGDADDSIPGFNDNSHTDADDVSKVFEHALNTCIKVAKETQ